MVVPNNERVGRGLDAVRDGIKPACEAAWKRAYGDDWALTVHSRDQNGQGLPDPNDLMFLIKGMHNTWNDVWRTLLGPAERSYSGEIRDARNRWAHGHVFSSDDTYRVLDTAERFLSSFGSPEFLAVVQGLKRDLQRQVFEEQARTEARKSAAKPTAGEPKAGLAPWREIISPHTDVASGRFEQAEFAADLYQVATNNAEDEYQDPVAFFGRTYLTTGLRELLLGAARRLDGQTADPVIDLQTNFGGGKTHSMIALYHLASGVPAASLPGVGELLAEEGLALPPKIARAAVIGQWLEPARPVAKPDGPVVHTMWGEIAYQLAGPAGYEVVRAADESGTNPGASLIELFRLAGPSVVMIDEWVRYAAQLPSRDGERQVCGGDFDTQFTFAQALTEAAAAVPHVIVLVSIPASEIELGGDRGQEARTRLSTVVRRVSKQWKPAEDDESFEIVRRRLFEPVTPESARRRDGVIRAFCDLYKDEAHKSHFPSEVREAEYRRRMELSYPIHPELFDRLYKDWSTLDRFQRTRGVLRFMASVISVLWQRGDQNLLIMPGTIPLDDQWVAAELVKYLEDGWDPVMRSDVDGANSLPLRLDADNKALGRYSAARRVARAVYMASAPREEGRRGIDIRTIALGAVQPGESPGTFSDAARHLSNAATFLYVDGAQYWYSLKPNITRMAADRAASNFDDHHADDEVKRRLQGLRDRGVFAAVHAFPDGPGDIADDDDGVHLVLLPPTHHHVANADDTPSIHLAGQIITQRNAGPRINRNMLVFCAAAEQRLHELRDAARMFLAWRSIVDDTSLELTSNDARQATTKRDETDKIVEQRIFETFVHVLVPEQQPGGGPLQWHQTRTSGSGSLPERVAKKLESEERLITRYGGTRVRMDLDRIPLWSERHDITVDALWKAYCQFPYLPRLASYDVLAHAIGDGVSKMMWDQETFAYAEGHSGDTWVGFHTVEHVTPARSGFVVHPAAAGPAIEAARVAAGGGGGGSGDGSSGGVSGDGGSGGGSQGGEAGPGAGVGAGRGAGGAGGPGRTDGGAGTGAESGSGSAQATGGPTRYYAQFDLSGARSIRQLEEILANVVDHLSKTAGANVTLTLEVNARSAGFTDTTRRVVAENAGQLSAKSNEFEP